MVSQVPLLPPLPPRSQEPNTHTFPDIDTASLAGLDPNLSLTAGASAARQPALASRGRSAWLLRAWDAALLPEAPVKVIPRCPYRGVQSRAAQT